MKVLLLSDTHGLHALLPNTLPEADVIVHAGDLGENKTDTRNFLHWFDTLNYRYKLFIAGNHDKYIQFNMEEFYHYHDYYRRRKQFGEGQIKFLFDEGIEIDGLVFYGSPWTRNLPRWAFQVQDGEDAEKVWAKIPMETDVLITHGPAYGIGDEVHPQFLRGREDAHVGCKALLERIKVVKPRIHVFGHIHEGRGIYNGDIEDVGVPGVISINASVIDENYQFYREDPKTIVAPFVIDL